ncbi:MAG: MBL fold metallo-hydrolase [Deltaproteobacteria bacterium]|nr:MBL fold metallo-hydrolase [Deltaproteobacteria bacterium]
MPIEHRDKEGRFFNPWEPRRSSNYGGLIKWLVFSRNRFRAEKKKKVEFNTLCPDFKSLDGAGKDYFVWLGHSTVFMRLGKKAVLTDPVLWDVNFMIKRKTPLPVKPEDLPKIDYCLVSHSHYDHLNTKSINYLKERFDPLFITGPGYGDYFKSLGVTKRAELDWWEGLGAEGFKITSLPVQHWSKRSFFDTNRMLWCSFLIERGGRKYLWAGDTGYFEGFKDIGKDYGPIDMLFIPVGAYEPRWFMKRNHLNPEEAVMTARDLKARLTIPIHWGTFDLTDEPLWLPIKRLKEVIAQGNSPEFVIIEHGGHYIVEPGYETSL